MVEHGESSEAAVGAHGGVAERIVVGAMMLDRDVIPKVTDIVSAEDFYTEKHRVIFSVIQELVRRGDPTDAVAVAGDLTQDRAKVPLTYLHDCIAAVPTSVNAPFYARTVAGQATARQAAEGAARLNLAAQSGDVGVILAAYTKVMNDLGQRLAAQRPEPASPVTGAGATPFIAGSGYAPRFPIHVLPEHMRQYVEDISIRKQVPVDLPALTMLGILGSLAGPRMIVRRDHDWAETTNIYICCALASGAAKSPVMNELRDGLWRARLLVHDRHERNLILRAAALKQQVEDLRTRANVTTNMDDREVWRAQAKTLEAEAQELETNPPPKPELVTDGDTTPEALAARMAVNDGYAGVIDDEGTFLRNLGGQYTGGKTGNLGLVLTAWDCRWYRPTRITRNALPIDRAALSLVISPQPGIVAGMMRDSMMEETGFINRFILCIPGDLVGQRQNRPSTYYLDAPEGNQVNPYQHWWAGLLEQVAAYDVIGGNELEDGAIVNLTRGAWKRHVEYTNAFEARMLPTGDLFRIKPWATKHCARVLRVAALLHLAAAWSTDDELAEATMEAAIEVGEWSIEHFLNAGSVAGMSSQAGRIKEYIDGTEAGLCDRTKLSADVFKNNASAAEIDEWVGELVATGEYVQDVIKGRGRPRKMIRRVVVRPD